MYNFTWCLKNFQEDCYFYRVFKDTGITFFRILIPAIGNFFELFLLGLLRKFFFYEFEEFL